MRLTVWIAAAAAVGCSFASAKADELSAADRRALVAEAGYEADASGKVENICGELVSPEFAPADIGGPVGVAELLIIPNGPNSADCYGDGPGDMYLMRRSGAGFHIVFADSARMAVLASTGADGVRDIALSRDGSYPVYRWDGDDYVSAGRNASRREYDASPAVP
jgi:hypothetical protein